MAGASSVLAIGGVLSPPAGAAAETPMITWGYNSNGQLGNGTTTGGLPPAPLSEPTDLTAADAGLQHSVALRSDGTVWAWGDNSFGQLGDGTTTPGSVTPRLVSSLTGVTAVAAGDHHSLALKSDGTVWAWGYGFDGQLGNNTTDVARSPVQVSALTGVTAVAGGKAHSLALKSDGTVWAWGDNAFGQLGNGTNVDSLTPVRVLGLTGMTAVAAGGYHSLALNSNGTVRAWGWNAYGQVGDGTVQSPRLTPALVSGLNNATAVAGGFEFSLALKSDGTVAAWGVNIEGQLGDGTNSAGSFVPVRVLSLSRVTAVAAGGYHSLAATSDGTLWTWGYNAYGQLGDGTTSNQEVPVQVSSVAGVTAVAAGTFHSMAIKGQGRPVASISPVQVNFGNQGVGTTSAPQSVVVTNTGEGPLEVASVALAGTNPGDFAISSNSCAAAVAPGGSCSVGVTFTPTAPFARAASLRIVDNALGSPHTVALSGVGLQADIAISATVRSWNIRRGEELSFTVTVSNLGPTSATGVTVTDVLPSNTTFVSATPSAGTCTTPSVGGTGNVVCTFGTVPNGSGNTRTVTIRVQASRTTVTNTATVSSSSSDPNPANNSVTITERVH